MNKKIIITIFILLVGISINFRYATKIKNLLVHNTISKVYAEDDEDEKEDEKDEDEDEDEKDDDNNEEESYYETVTVPSPKVTTQQPQIRYIYVTDVGYDRDTDGDKIVDALDPNPTISEYDLFTDDDNDGIPNAHDKYKDEDDFLYADFIDANNNGILDELEQIK